MSYLEEVEERNHLLSEQLRQAADELEELKTQHANMIYAVNQRDNVISSLITRLLFDADHLVPFKSEMLLKSDDMCLTIILMEAPWIPKKTT